MQTQDKKFKVQIGPDHFIFNAQPVTYLHAKRWFQSGIAIGRRQLKIARDMGIQNHIEHEQHGLATTLKRLAFLRANKNNIKNGVVDISPACE